MELPLSWVRARCRFVNGLFVVAVLFATFVGCARLPVPAQVIHEDQRLMVRTERVFKKDERYTHPTMLNADELAIVLKGLVVRERPGSPLRRLFGETARPERLFQEHDFNAVASSLAEGLRVAKPDEHVAFALFAPGPNPGSERFVTSGWIAIRDPYLHVAVNEVRHLQSQSPTVSYYPFFQEIPSSPPLFDVIFEHQTYWVEDPTDSIPAVQFREYLRKAVGPGEGR